MSFGILNEYVCPYDFCIYFFRTEDSIHDNKLLVLKVFSKAIGG